MRKQAFFLVAAVIGVQLAIMSGVLIGCFRTNNCKGEKVAELMTFITAQSFALYAAEK